MQTGHVVADRFEIARVAGEGGMGRVYQARDRLSGADVAIKVLHAHGAHELTRFGREARVLAALQHPGVVRYVAHGATEDDRPYLVMDWLEGETLSARLRRDGLSVAESVAMARRLTTALAAVHRVGVVHRDVKPSNVFLVERDVDRPLLIDFGIAREGGPGPRITLTGAMLGTPGYMAPEQARGEPGIDARADVFSLGCVLFKCLTGRDAFTGDDPLGVLMKVVLEDPPRARDLNVGVPPALDDLLARLLAKPRGLRPYDGDAVSAELAALDVSAQAAPLRVPSVATEAREITTHERKVMCLLLVRGAFRDAETRAAYARPWPLELEAVAQRHGGRVEVLGDDAVLLPFAGVGVPTDLAVRAARCALSLRSSLASAPMALATGRAEVEDRLPVGALIDRVLGLLSPGAIRVDDVTAGLLGARFELRPAGGGLVVHAEREVSAPAHVLLGRPTPFVGRERELAVLEASFAHVTENEAASAVLVTAPAGAGKSRLCHELLRRLRGRAAPFELWVGHGDPMSAGAAFALLARALRGALGLHEHASLEARRAAIQRRTARLPDAERVAVFAGELLGAPFPEEQSAQLQAARRDPALMGDQLRRAAEDLLRAACAEQPVLLVLEDLQWGDLPSVSFVDAALSNLADRPLLVLAFARPEVREIFPRLWHARDTQTVPLADLPRRAAERLLKQVLGDATPPERVEALIERAGGNAFYLEELIRAMAAGGGAADLPETVLAMAQARLEALDPEARRILRAASIFGRAFSRRGVEALLGGTKVDDRLDELVAAEVLVYRSEAEAGVEYGFRQELLREAAYGMLVEADRVVGHKLAGAWLEQEGKAEATALAEHFERGGEPARAAAWFLRSAKDALRGNDLVAALERAARASVGACADDLGQVRLVQAEAHLWRGDIARSKERAIEAAWLLTPGSSAWYWAICHVFHAASRLGELERAERTWAAPLLDTPPAQQAQSAYVICLASYAGVFAMDGRYATADMALERARAFADDPSAIDAQALGALHEASAVRSAGDPGVALRDLEAALCAFDKAGDHRNGCVTRNNLGFVFAQLGDFPQAEATLRAALDDADRMGLHETRAHILENLGCAVTRLGRFDEARQLLNQALEADRQQGSVRSGAAVRKYLAQVALGAGDLDCAEREARAAVDALVVAPPLRAGALAVLALVLLRRGPSGEALPTAEEAFALLEAVGGTLEEDESLVRLVHAEALEAAGRTAEAAHALMVGRERLLERAARIRDPVRRERFLTQVWENAAVMARATKNEQ